MNCSFSGFTYCVLSSSSSSTSLTANFYNCEFASWSTAGISRASSGGGYIFEDCYFHDGTGTALAGSTTSHSFTVRDCIFDTVTSGYGISLSRTTTPGCTLIVDGCTFYSCADSCISFGQTSGTQVYIAITNNIFSGGTYAIRNANAGFETSGRVLVTNNAFYNQGTGKYLNFADGQGDIDLSADPFTAASTADFTPNNTATGGADVRAASYPATFMGSTTTQYRDVGAAQHQDPSGGSSQHSYSG